jgi:uncharacterized protein (TIGR00159 family)
MCLLGSIPALNWIKSSLSYLDVGLVIILIYLLLLIIEQEDRRTFWMVRGFIMLMVTMVVSQALGLKYLTFVLEKLVFGAGVAMAVMFQSQFRRFLEQLGRLEVRELIQTKVIRNPTQSDSVVEEIVDAIKELSQKRTGALILLETKGLLDDRDFVSEGVPLNAEVSKELLQTIFQTSTLLHDGAVFIRGSRIVGAGVILPLSERNTSRQLGTRHRAAMGMTEKAENCLCIVVSEETGSISLAEKGILNRPLTSSKLKELLLERFSPVVEREAGRLSRKIGFQGRLLLGRIFRIPSSISQDKK